MSAISKKFLAIVSIAISLILVILISFFSLKVPLYFSLAILVVPIFSILKVLRAPRKYEGEFDGKVSIVIAAKNEEIVIEKTIREAEKMDYENFEIVVIDDGSTDSTAEKLNRLKLEYKNLRVLHVPVESEIHGKAAALNRAFTIVSGDVVLIIDADVLLNKDFLKEATRPFENPDIGAVQTGIRGYNIVNFISFLGDADLAFTNILMEYLLNPRSFGTGFLIRRSVIEKILPLKETTISEDAQISLAIRGLGMRSVFHPLVVSSQSVPVKFLPLFKQRKRWFLGALTEMIENNKLLFLLSIFGTFLADAAFALLPFKPFSPLATLLLSLFFSSLLITTINFKRFNIKNPFFTWFGTCLSYVFDLVVLSLSAFQVPFSINKKLKWYKTPREGVK